MLQTCNHGLHDPIAYEGDGLDGCPLCAALAEIKAKQTYISKLEREIADAEFKLELHTGGK